MFEIRYTINGRLHFLRVGRLCLSFCIASKPAKRYRNVSIKEIAQ